MSGPSLVAELEGLVETCAARLGQALALEELEAVRVEYLGRKGMLAAIMSRLPGLDPDARREAGKAANTVKERLTGLYDGRLAELSRAAMDVALAGFDPTVPGYAPFGGSLHPVTLVTAEICKALEELGFSIVTELGPLLVCLILAGRAGAAFTAEIATMRISEEIDALEVMGIDPVRFLIWPKFAAMCVMAPLLTLWGDAVGITAGGVFSALALGLPGKAYFLQTANFLGMRDVAAGLIKSAGFGITITIVSCWQGLLAREGAADVGRRTTRAVVQSIFLMILLDLFFTALNYIFR
mgnify:CR=1 FL=1